MNSLSVEVFDSNPRPSSSPDEVRQEIIKLANELITIHQSYKEIEQLPYEDKWYYPSESSVILPKFDHLIGYMVDYVNYSFIDHESLKEECNILFKDFKYSKIADLNDIKIELLPMVVTRLIFAEYKIKIQTNRLRRWKDLVDKIKFAMPK